MATFQGAEVGAYYGREFLHVMASLYPGYHGTPRLADTIVGTLYGLVDGALAGLIVAWLYNALSAKPVARRAPD